ncbi:MAG: hypothetical protein ACUVSQ_10640 [Pseudanabaenaceae cyanobacterium]
MHAATNAAARTKVHHATLQDIQDYTPEKLGHLYRGGMRSGPSRSDFDAQRMLDKVPPSQRAGVDARSAAMKTKGYLADKDASHITPHSQGGSSHPDNLKWETQTTNRARGNRPMTAREQHKIDVQAQTANLQGALQAGLEALPRGAAIGAAVSLPLSALRNALRVMRQEISAWEAVQETLKDTAIGAGVAGATNFTVTTVATACPPIAAALTAVSPVLLVAGGAGLVHSFFGILHDHRQQVKAYYESLTQQDRAYLQKLEEELNYEHHKNLQFLAEARTLREEVVNRPREAGTAGALQRYRESKAIAQSLAGQPSARPFLPGGSSTPLLPS